MNAITKTNISICKTKADRYEDGTPWMDLFENVSVYKLWPEAFIQNSRTKRAGTTYYFLSPRTRTCDIIFMAGVADMKRNFNATKAKKTTDLQPTKDFTKLDLQQTNFEKCELEIVAPITLFRHCVLRKLSEKGTHLKSNANYFYFSTTKWIFIIAHKNALQGNEGSNKILK